MHESNEELPRFVLAKHLPTLVSVRCEVNLKHFPRLNTAQSTGAKINGARHKQKQGKRIDDGDGAFGMILMCCRRVYSSIKSMVFPLLPVWKPVPAVAQKTSAHEVSEKSA